MSNQTVYNVFVKNPTERIADQLNEITSLDPTFKPLLPSHLYVTKQQKEFINNYIQPDVIFRFYDLKKMLHKIFPKLKISTQVLSAYLDYKGYTKVSLISQNEKRLTFWKHKDLKL